ncbi:MAG: Antitoxin 1 [Steroidobacteraceae bacterium]|nr:Antitoxin 1 [Steroidobacteraceae bacterium]
MIQLRHVPDSLHQQLKSRAALAGLSLSNYLIREARKIIERPSSEEIFGRLAHRSRISPRISPADAVRRERDTR